ncbi:MAG: hypothetical protein HXY44_11945 [Syntrophaceae bacterium]|nr:hypothetical protein [Syntrophaceae bacterium]
MSIAFELFKSIGKRPCPPGSRVDRCPIVINENSEDLLTSNVFGLLKFLPPTAWPIPLLEMTFKGRTFGPIERGKIKVEFWKKLPSPPGAKYHEGTPEIDIVIKIGRLIVLLEAKYRSPIQGELAREHKRDQILKYLDCGVHNLWPESGTPCEILFVLLTDMEREPETLSQYRDPEKILAGLTQARPFIDYEDVSRRLARNIGHARWRDLLQILENQDAKRLNPTESMIIADLIVYLRHKLRATK